jgi:hypothetical protein
MTRHLNPGKGARATVLTKLIKPKQPWPSVEHRSDITLIERFSNDKGQLYYSFRYSADNNSPLLSASVRYVKIVQEGDKSDFFDPDNIEQTKKKKKVKWKDSKAKRLLLDDVKHGVVPVESTPSMPLKDIYLMHPEYAEHSYSKFSSRLYSIRKVVAEANNRSERDQQAFDMYVSNNPISFFSSKGYIQWQGSDSQRLCLDDIEQEKHKTMSKRDLYDSRSEYYDEFPYKVFKEKLKQEIRTAKYLYTLEIRGKQHQSS